VETIELPPAFITLAARELRDPKSLALQVLANYVLERAWHDIHVDPAAVLLSEK
jgi:hypothetical protein